MLRIPRNAPHRQVQRHASIPGIGQHPAVYINHKYFIFLDIIGIYTMSKIKLYKSLSIYKLFELENVVDQQNI